jgi:hypothetical protein
MKHIALLPFICLLFLQPLGNSHAQVQFGIESFCLDNKALAQVSLPAAAIAEAIKGNEEGIKPADACLTTPLTGQANGYQADFDGDGKEEMWLLYHSGPADAGCNAVLMVSPIGGGKYTLHELVSMIGGKALIRPIKCLDKGTQMYFQVAYKGADGKIETRGSLLAYTQTAIVPLTTWLQKNVTREGKVLTQDIRAALYDVTFDGRKEVLLQYSYYAQAGGKLIDKNLVDRYVLTLDFVPASYQYGLFDSTGYSKIQQADALAKSGQRMVNKASTSADGITKVREALRLNPFMTKSRVLLGRYFLNSGRYADAEKTLLDASGMDPKYPTTYQLLGDTYLRLNDMQKALSAYTTYLELNPDAHDKSKIKQNINHITVPKGRRP